MARSHTNTRNYTPRSVYLIECPELSICKIGIATRPLGRLKTLQTSFAFRLRLLGYWSGTILTEKAIHRMLAGYRKSGEWFQVPLDAASNAIAHCCKLDYEKVWSDISSVISGDKSHVEKSEPAKRTAVIIHESEKVSLKSYLENYTLPDLPHIEWNIRNGQELAVYFKSESKMPMKRWIHLGFVDDAFFKDSASLRIWVETRVEVLGLRYYEPDKDFWQWMEMDKRG